MFLLFATAAMNNLGARTVPDKLMNIDAKNPKSLISTWRLISKGRSNRKSDQEYNESELHLKDNFNIQKEGIR